jgi:hypothetical protein
MHRVHDNDQNDSIETEKCHVENAQVAPTNLRMNLCPLPSQQVEQTCGYGALSTDLLRASKNQFCIAHTLCCFFSSLLDPQTTNLFNHDL